MLNPVLRKWMGLAIGVFVLAGIGLGIAWRRRRPESDLRPAGVLAYSHGDWSRAADLARQQLKTAPDDIEALRLLARATARLGRDGAANALFARLGSAALQAED